MSLAEAVLEIADQLDEFVVAAKSEVLDGPATRVAIIGFARSLRSSVKAAFNSFEYKDTPRIEKTYVQQMAERQAAREESADVMTLCVGGTNDGTMTYVPAKFPIGAKTVIDQQIYVIGEDRKLYFSAEETDKLHATNKSPGILVDGTSQS